MSNYTQTTFFAPKDALPPGNPAKTIFGAPYDVEFGNIATAIASKVDSSGGPFAVTTASTIFTFSATVGTVIPTLGLAGNVPMLQFNNTSAGANRGIWQLTEDNFGTLTLATVTDTGGLGKVALSFTRSPTTAITGISIGNNTDASTLGLLSLGGSLTRTTTGAWTLAPPVSGVALTITGISPSFAVLIASGATVGSANGVLITAGSAAADVAFEIQSQATTTNFMLVRGDGSGFLGWNGTANIISFAAVGTVTIAAPATGTTRVFSAAGSAGSNYSIFANGASIAVSDGDYPAFGFNMAATGTTGVYNYIVSDFATRMWSNVGTFTFQTAVSGVGGNPITWVTQMTIPNLGGVTVKPGPTNGELLITSAALTAGPGASAGTLTNAPSAGNPTKWIKINDNGTIRAVPSW